MKYLLEKGADIKSINDTKEDVKNLTFYGTPVIYASVYGYLDVVKCLVENGARLDIKTGVGNSALNLAIEMGKFDVAKYLIESGALIDDEDHYGYTPLMYAVTKFQPDLVKFIVEHGANVNLKNKKDKTVMDILEVQEEIQKQLKDYDGLQMSKEIKKFLKEQGARKSK